MSTPRLGIPVLVLAAVICGLLALPAMASSQARIVRLSDVEGTVQIDRDAGQGYERAFLNMPIVQGTKLWTKEDGRAEVEFEDGTVVRIVPNTKINFSELSLRDSGGKLNTLNLQEGTAYVNFEGKKDDEFVINFGRESARLTHPAHFRVEMDDAEATLAVLKGSVDLQGPSGSFEVGKKQTATFDLADNDRHEIAKNFEQDPYDNWDKQQAQYHDRYFNNSSYSNSNYPYSYGVSDLNYYGSYYNVPGYGNMWQPYFAGPGFVPFMNGAWCWYPGNCYGAHRGPNEERLDGTQQRLEFARHGLFRARECSVPAHVGTAFLGSVAFLFFFETLRNCDVMGRPSGRPFSF